jgi:Zn-dependent protease with chaperone function
MYPLKRLLVLAIGLALLCQMAFPLPLSAKVKEIKVRGYITSLTSPTSFEIEDYRVTRDESIQLEFDNQTAGMSFKPEDLRVGTLVELRGQFNDETNELKTTKIKIDLRQFRELNVTTILESRPSELNKVEGDKWRGIVIADGRRIRIEPDAQVFFKLNKTEKKEAEKEAKAQKKQQGKSDEKSNKAQPLAQAPPSQTDSAGAAPASSPESDSAVKPEDEDETTAAEEAVGAGPLTSLADIGPGVIMTYAGKEQADGTVLVSKVTFIKNEMTRGEKNLWKQVQVKEKPANFVEGKPGELKVGKTKYKVLPNQEVQDYVNRIGQSLIPAYQKNLPEGDPNKIPFKFVVIIQKGFNAGAYPNGTIVIHDDVFQILENEAQLAAIIGHEIAHATQEHSFRQVEHNKKRRRALLIASIFAAGMGYYAISNVLDMVNAAMINGYSRTMENQADRIGLHYLVDAGYDPREAPRVWKLVTKKYGDMPTNFFWSNHDSNTERRSFEMLTIRNSFGDADFSRLKKEEGAFERIVALALEANPKNKKRKIKVTS